MVFGPRHGLSREEGRRKAEHPCHLLQFLKNTCTSGSVNAEFLLLCVFAGTQYAVTNFHSWCCQCKHFAFCFTQGKVRIPFSLCILWKHYLCVAVVSLDDNNSYLFLALSLSLFPIVGFELTTSFLRGRSSTT
jgi:hypothetical protein